MKDSTRRYEKAREHTEKVREESRRRKSCRKRLRGIEEAREHAGKVRDGTKERRKVSDDAEM